jgi:hypothetical protein
MALPNYKDIADLVEKGLTLEAKGKIIELREAVLGLQEENIALKMRIGDLEAQQNKKQSLRHIRSLYYADGDAVPFCPKCWETQTKTIHLFKIELGSTNSERWQCHVCDCDFHATNGGAFSALTIPRRR